MLPAESAGAAPATLTLLSALPGSPKGGFILRTLANQTYFSENTPLLYDIFYPDGKGPFPALVLFFGGGWTQGRKEQMHPMGEYFTAKGWAVLTPQYRTKQTHGTALPNSVADGAAFWKWLLKNTAELCLDPARLALGGGSSGGQLAIMAALLSGHMPAAFVLYNPALDTASLSIRLGYGTTWPEFSPLRQVRAPFAPTLIMHGTADRLVPIRTSKRFCQTLTGLGCTARLIPYKGKRHGFFNKSVDEACFYSTCQNIEAFLQQVL